MEGDSDFEEDLALVTGKELPQEKHKNDKTSKKNNEVIEKMEETDEEIESDGELDDGSETDESNEDLSEGESFDYESDMEEEKIYNKNEKSTQKEKIIKEDDLSKVFSDDEVSHLSGDESLEGEFPVDSDEERNEDGVKKNVEEKPDVWEDIYGRKRDKEGNVIKVSQKNYIVK